MSQDSPSTSKLLTVNQSKYCHKILQIVIISLKLSKYLNNCHNIIKSQNIVKIVTTMTILRVCDLLDYTADDLTGKSMYSLVHAADVHKIKQTHVDCK